ncbi:MAG: hypothetical protein JJE51_13785 [Thermoanaerobaculia bacterium]|nr:hypothetical protein [Thermoanaerobaculia bacterium]
MYGRNERLTRQELYELVWTTPMMKLCERFQLSDRGLAKLCERHEVPVPERGWWAKHAAGHPVQRTELPKATNPYHEHIQVWVREDWRQYLSAEDHDWFQQRLACESNIPAPTTRAEDDSRHPLIVHARRARKESERARMQFALNVSKELRNRALRLAAALVEACEKRGYEFALRPKTETGAAGVVILGQNIGIAIEESFTKVPHVLTKTEAREKALGRGWSIPDFDSLRSGELTVVLDHSINGERRLFGEKPERPLESSFPELFKALLKVAIRMRADENYRVWQAQREQEAAERRAEAERQRRAEEARITQERRRRREVISAGARLRQSKNILDLIATVESTASARGLSTDALTSWVTKARAVAIDLNPIDRILDDVAPPYPASEAVVE